MTRNFALLLFATDPKVVGRSVAGGVDGIVVDWEREGKHARQAGADTQVGADTEADLRSVRAATDGLVICRVDSDETLLPLHVEAAIDGGADEVLLPMVRSADDVKAALDLIGGRCRLGVLIETADALDDLVHLAQLPLSRAYAGLNDLSIQRGSATIFTPVVDGTLERIRAAFSCPFGFGGLTLPNRGEPIPARLLIAEMARLRCDFTFLRRSYLADMAGRDPAVEIPRLRQAVAEADSRTASAVAHDRASLAAAIGALERTRASA